MNAGDTGFMLICTAFVFFMTPGLAFYGGLVRRKNVVNTMMACAAIMGLSVVMWTLFGYSLAFGGNHGGIIGDFRWFAMNGVGWEPGPYADTIPHLVFAAFQMMFAMITPALITGAVVGRMRFKALFLFVAIWPVIVYYPMAHMVWGDGGFLAAIGSVDFAGGNVVHISSGVSALVLAIYLKQRRGYAKATYRTHNIPFVFLGAAMLWFGWFGFNAGSALKADGLAAHAFMTSSISSACALLTWMLIEVIREGKPTLVGASTGLVIGLVAITPGAGFVPVWASFIIGILVSPICYFTVILLKQKLKIDDALDAFGCHGIGVYGRNRNWTFRKIFDQFCCKMGWPCIWRLPSVSGTGFKYCDHHCCCHCGNTDLYWNRAYFYTASCRSEGRTGWSGRIPAWRECISVIQWI